jgi:RND superfamily putative drug exporter
MKALADFCYRRRRYVLAGWVVLLAGLFALSGVFGGEYKTEFKLPGSESQAAVDLLKEKGANDRTGFVGQVVFRADQGAADPQVRRTLEAFFADIESTVADVSVSSPFDPQNSHQVSSDGKVAYAEINLDDADAIRDTVQ